MITSQKLGGIGESTRFEFQYVPALGKITELAPVHRAIKKTTKSSKAQITVVLVISMGLALVSWLLGLGMPWLQGTTRSLGSMIVPQGQGLGGSL